jgi:flagellar protein FliS
MSMQAYQQYQRTQAQTASPGELIVMMYNGALKFLTAARMRLDAHDIEATNRNLLRAQDIILELMVSVDTGVGPVGRNLFDLYEFMHRHLVQANIRKDGQMIDEVAGLLRDLLPAWQQAIVASAKVSPLRPAAMGDSGALRVASA